MNFADDYKNKMEDQEYEEMPFEDEEEFPSFLDFLTGKMPSQEEQIKIYKGRTDVKLAIFQHMNQRLIDLGYEDKEERYRIMEILL